MWGYLSQWVGPRHCPTIASHFNSTLCKQRTMMQEHYTITEMKHNDSTILLHADLPLACKFYPVKSNIHSPLPSDCLWFLFVRHTATRSNRSVQCTTEVSNLVLSISQCQQTLLLPQFLNSKRTRKAKKTPPKSNWLSWFS